MEKYFLKKPNIKNELSVSDINNKITEYRELIDKSNNPEYLYWDKLKYKAWIKEKINPDDFWNILEFVRKINLNEVEYLKTENDTKLYYNNLQRFSNFIEEIEAFAGKNNRVQNEDFFIMNNIIEESISSSQIEGAKTTREEAKKIIQEKKKNLNQHQQMIVNNYKAMDKLLTKYKDFDFSAELLLELHSILLENDKKIDPNKIGKFRDNDDDIIISDNEYTTHKAPNIEYVKQELSAIADFLKNSKLHMILKAIILHFMIGYLHPFCDGNGRLARCLFYWYLIKNGYKYLIFLPISRVIKTALKQYGMAYIYTEQNDFDLTYFIDYNIRKMQQAKLEFEKYYSNKIQELTAIQDDFKKMCLNNNLNLRQEFFMKELLNKKIEYLTIKKYAKKFKITRQTASKDMQDLVEKNCLKLRKNGRQNFYSILH